MSPASIGGGFWGANATCVGFNLSQAPLFAGKAERCSDLKFVLRKGKQFQYEKMEKIYHAVPALFYNRAALHDT